MQSPASTSRTVLEDMSLEPFPYSLDIECPVAWPSSQETTICQDYPFPCVDEESGEDFVIRRYLETLWLPESIMPLHHFVQSLRRYISSPSKAHPLHVALKPLLLSVRGTQDKYHLELPRILQDGGGAGELEESMMWFAWSKEKFEPSDRDSGSDEEEAWRKIWMERLERREVQIQILIYLQLLSLPPPPPTTPTFAPSKTKRRKHKAPHGPPSPVKPIFPPTSSVEAAAIASTPPTPAKSTASFTGASVDESLSMEDRLEYFMDRLCLWQLVASLNPPNASQPTSSQPNSKDSRDWMQVFCEDVVEPLFKDRLPEQCALLRTKVFPHSPFSDDSDDGSSPPPPDLRARAKSKTKGKRPASPLRIEELEKPATKSRAGSAQRGESMEPGGPERHRSRSRSVSISMEEVRARGASRGGVASSKNLFKGEVEMKRTASRGSKLFKPPQTGTSHQAGIRQFSRQNSRNDAFPPTAPSRASQPRSPSQSREPRTLAADTPVKKPVKVEEDDPDVVMDSPDALLLTGQSQWGFVEADEEEVDGEVSKLGKLFAADTPIKKRSRR